jgi:hypothetical protein
MTTVCRFVICWGPIIEELYHRVFIQKSVKWVANQAFKRLERKEIQAGILKIDHQGIHLGRVTLGAEKIAILVSSVHFTCGHNVTLIGALIHLPGTLIYGYLAESDGVIASLGAHMANNATGIALGVVERR